jgi:hypothetical protein
MDWSNSPHELAHNFDRYHSFTDPDYPGDASVGELFQWGFGQRPGLLSSPAGQWEMENTFFDPAQYYDITSYTHPHWISAYTYNGSFEVLRIVSAWGDQSTAAEAQVAEYYASRSIRGIRQLDGSWRWQLALGHPDASATDEAMAAQVFRRGSPQGLRIPIAPVYATGRFATTGTRMLGGVTIPLTAEQTLDDLEGFVVEVDGERIEVAAHEVTNPIATDLDWRVQIDAHNARRAAARLQLRRE